MKAEIWIRRGALAAIPLLFALGYWLRTEPVEETASAESALAGAASVNPSGSVPDPLGTAGVKSETSARGSSAKSEAPRAETPESQVTEQRAGEAALAKERLPANVPLPPAPKFDPLPSRAVAARDLPQAPSGKIEIELVPDQGSSLSSTCGGLDVRLITYSDDPSWAFASIAEDRDSAAQIRHVGDSIGGFRVTKIEWDRVWVQSGDTQCAVGMHLGVREAAGERSAGTLPADHMPGQRPSWELPRELVNALEPRSESEDERQIVIDRRMIQAFYQRGSDLFAGMKLEPVKNDERVVGLKLKQVPEKSLLDHLGLEPGDVITSLNEVAITTLEQLIEVLEQSKERQELVSHWKRGGEPFVLRLVAA